MARGAYLRLERLFTGWGFGLGVNPRHWHWHERGNHGNRHVERTSTGVRAVATHLGRLRRRSKFSHLFLAGQMVQRLSPVYFWGRTAISGAQRRRVGRTAWVRRLKSRQVALSPRSTRLVGVPVRARLQLPGPCCVFYGTTQHGGPNDAGTVFQVTSAGAEKVLFSFGNGASDGAVPVASLVLTKDGKTFAGTTTAAGRTPVRCSSILFLRFLNEPTGTKALEISCAGAASAIRCAEARLAFRHTALRPRQMQFRTRCQTHFQALAPLQILGRCKTYCGPLALRDQYKRHTTAPAIPPTCEKRAIPGMPPLALNSNISTA
jgi:uncharacterized repeat protein (TIGR03803 family)